MRGAYGLSIPERELLASESGLCRVLGYALEEQRAHSELWSLDASAKARLLTPHALFSQHEFFANCEEFARSRGGEEGRWGLTFLYERVTQPQGLEEMKRFARENQAALDSGGIESAWTESGRERIADMAARKYSSMHAASGHIAYVERLALHVGGDALCPGTRVAGVKMTKYRDGSTEFKAHSGSIPPFGKPARFFEGLAHSYGPLEDPRPHIGRMAWAYAQALGTTRENVVPVLEAIWAIPLGNGVPRPF